MGEETEIESGGAAADRSFSPSGFLKVSIAAHVAGAAALAAAPSSWPWVLGGVLGNHTAIALGGLIPRSHFLGENWTRLPEAAIARREVAVTFDDSPDPEVTPRVLDILARAGAQASFFVIGARARQHGALLREMLGAGHSLENHTWHHPGTFSFYGLRRYREEITRAQTAIADAAGAEPRFFRPPVGLRNVLLYPILSELGLTHVSWTRRGFDTIARDPAAVLARLTSGLRAGDILVLHDGHHRAGRRGRAIAVQLLPLLLDRIAERGLRPVSLARALR